MQHMKQGGETMSGTGPVCGNNWAFILFLILILLVFCCFCFI